MNHLIDEISLTIDKFSYVVFKSYKAEGKKAPSILKAKVHSKRTDGYTWAFLQICNEVIRKGNLGYHMDPNCGQVVCGSPQVNTTIGQTCNEADLTDVPVYDFGCRGQIVLFTAFSEIDTLNSTDQLSWRYTLKCGVKWGLIRMRDGGIVEPLKLDKLSSDDLKVVLKVFRDRFPETEFNLDQC